MKVKNMSIGLVLLLAIGVITVYSFSLGCTEQGENVSKPVVNNTSVQPESVNNTSLQSESVNNTSLQSESVNNTSVRPESVNNTSSQSVSSNEGSSESSSSSGSSSGSSSSNDGSSESGSSSGSSSESGSSENTSQQLDPVSADSIIGVKWLWTGYEHAGENIQVSNPELYTLSLSSDGTYYLKTDCNSGSGSYILEGNDLTLNTATMTLVACGPDSMDPEYTSLITGVKSATMKDSQLVLYSSEGDTMFFNNGGQAEQ